MASTDLPEPVAPTSARVCPGSTVKLTWRKTRPPSGKPKPTSSNSTRPPPGGPPRASPISPSVISTGASKISAIRSAAVIASWVIAHRKPSEAIGHTSDSIMVMNATSVPMLTRPRPAA